MTAFDLDSFYRRFGEAVFRRARRILGDDASAHDAVQETFLRAHRYAHTWAGGSALSWLFTIADRVCFDALKKRRRTNVVDDDVIAALLASDEGVGDVARPPVAGARLERDQQVATALLGLDDQTRQILLHRYFDDLDTRQIAAALSTSERTIRRRLDEFFTHARARLARADDHREVRP